MSTEIGLTKFTKKLLEQRKEYPKYRAFGETVMQDKKLDEQRYSFGYHPGKVVEK